jgi:hypothetical protein
LFSSTVFSSTDVKQAINEAEEVIAAESKVDDVVKQKIMDADESFQKVTDAYHNGDYELTKEEYQKFLEKLKNIDIDPEMTTFLLTDFENILIKLKNINNIGTCRKEFNKNSNKNEVSLAYNQDILDKWMRIYTSGKSKERVKLALERSGKYRDMIFKV